jgi:hypothetical protein
MSGTKYIGRGHKFVTKFYINLSGGYKVQMGEVTNAPQHFSQETNENISLQSLRICVAIILKLNK